MAERATLHFWTVFYSLRLWKGALYNGGYLVWMGCKKTECAKKKHISEQHFNKNRINYQPLIKEIGCLKSKCVQNWKETGSGCWIDCSSFFVSWHNCNWLLKVNELNQIVWWQTVISAIRFSPSESASYRFVMEIGIHIPKMWTGSLLLWWIVLGLQGRS